MPNVLDSTQDNTQNSTPSTGFQMSISSIGRTPRTPELIKAQELQAQKQADSMSMLGMVGAGLVFALLSLIFHGVGEWLLC